MLTAKPTAIRHRRGRLARLVACCLLAGLAALAPSSALAQQASHLRISEAAYGGTQPLTVELNKSVLVDLPADAAEVIVSQPSVAGTTMRSKRRAVVQGTGSGDTNIFFLDALGRTITVLDIKVTQRPSDVASALQTALGRVLPGSNIRVESVLLDGTNRVVLTGTTQSTDDIAKATAMAVQFAGDEKNVSNVLTVSGSQQVMLKVTVAEVSRDAVEQLGLNLEASLSGYGMSTSLISQPTLGGASNVLPTSAVGAGFNAGPVSVNATLQALTRRGAIRTLAEPILTAMSGQSAEFLAGGEFPVPTGYDAKEDVVSFEFKEFGVKLNFTPVVKSNGIIGLAVETEVSEPTTEGGFNLGELTIPATNNRRAKTSVEMGAGSTLAIGGMFREQVRQQFNSMPGIDKVPILGALFRSRDFVTSRTELLILVTPYLAQATTAAVTLPTDTVDFAGDAEAIFLGHMEKLYGVSGHAEAAGGFRGAVGFVLD